MTDSVPSRPIVGVLWMLFTGICFVAVTALVKYLGPRVPAPEAAFLRYLIGCVFFLPFVLQIMRTRITKRQFILFGTRGFVHSIGVTFWFFAMTQIPIAEVTAMNYLSPVYVTIGAAIFLGEKLAIRRIMAVIVALVGVVIILRPGFREISPGHLAMLGTAVLFAGGYLIAKVVSGELNPIVVVAMLSVTVTIGLAPMAAAVWVTPTLSDLLILSGVAAFATAGHYSMTLAFAAAPITLTQPVSFLQLVWAALLGWVVFDEGLDIWVIVGGLLIISAISFITWRESVLKRRQMTPLVNATKV